MKMRINASDKAYLDGLLGAYGDFSDGAWQAACEAAIADDPRFNGCDPYEVWLAWAISKSVSGREEK